MQQIVEPGPSHGAKCDDHKERYLIVIGWDGVSSSMGEEMASTSTAGCPVKMQREGSGGIGRDSHDAESVEPRGVETGPQRENSGFKV